MYLGAVKAEPVSKRHEIIQSLIDNEEHFQRWVEHPCSSIVHHDQACCEEARLWFLAYARSMEVGALSRYQLKAPTWLSQLFTWGPSEWPISWCEVVKQEVIDCGVFAALAREIFAAQGLSAHPAQVLLSYNQTCTDHWKDLWKAGPKEPKKEKKSGETFPWIGNQIVYHELCVLEMPDGQAKVYDSTWGTWYEPRPRTGFGALLALRTECPRLLNWGGKTMSCGEWIDL
jgi:hypothetical protein